MVQQKTKDSSHYNHAAPIIFVYLSTWHQYKSLPTKLLSKIRFMSLTNRAGLCLRPTNQKALSRPRMREFSLSNNMRNPCTWSFCKSRMCYISSSQCNSPNCILGFRLMTGLSFTTRSFTSSQTRPSKIYHPHRPQVDPEISILYGQDVISYKYV